MDPATHRRMRTAHTNHTHECACDKVVRGNGGWASHAWSCRVYQTRHHDDPDNRWTHNPARCHLCPA